MAADHTDRPLGLGVVGCGSLAYWTHLPLANRLRGARLVGAADPDDDARHRAKARIAAPIVPGLDELLELDGLDAVIVATPTHDHSATTERCLAAGKHVYVEKPIADSREQASRVGTEVQRSGRTLRVGFNRRLHPAFEQAKRAIQNDHIGTVRSISMRFCEPVAASEMPSWKAERATGGGVLLDLASHHVDLVRWLLDEEVARVRAHIRSRESDHDEAWLDLHTRGGVRANGFYSFLAGRSDTMDIIGSRATIRIDRHRTAATLQASRRIGYGVRNQRLPTTAATWAWRFARLTRPSVESSFQRALQQFVDECNGRSGRVLADFEDGRRNLEVLLAAEASALSEGAQPVSLPEL